jgi:hypothetical protein
MPIPPPAAAIALAPGIAGNPGEETAGMVALTAQQLLIFVTTAVAEAPTTEPVAVGVLWNDGGVITLSVGIPPVFTLQPQSDVIIDGTVVVLTWTATNATSFQVQSNDGSGWEDVAGATSSPYTTPPIEIADSGIQYRVSAIGPGGGPVYSDTATITVDPLHPSTSEYMVRVASAGGTVTPDGTALIDSIFSHAEDESLTLLRGYLFGSAVNVDSTTTRTVLELTGDGQTLTADAASDGSVLSGGAGSLCLSGDIVNQGRLSLSSESLFDNTDWTIFFYVQKPLRDDQGASGIESTYVISQYPAFANGSIRVTSDQTGGLSITVPGGTSINVTAGNIPGSQGGGLILPLTIFLTYVASTKELKAYNARTGALLGTGAAHSGGFTATATQMGNTAETTRRPNVLAMFGVLKYAGVLTGDQMDGVYETFFGNHCRLVDRVWIIGNSVTSGSDAQEATLNGARNWPSQFAVHAAQNNCITLRPSSMGGKTIYYFRPSDYTKPVESARPSVFPTYSSADSVDTWKLWKPTILVIDENQNTAANDSTTVDYEVDYGGCIDAITDDLRELIPDLKVVCGTQLAVGPAGMTLAEIIALETSSNNVWRKNLRDWSVLIRTDDRFDAFAEIYGAFNLGWDAASDGDAAAPLTDYPNGDPSLFFDDHQHPNFAGHTLMATAFIDAVESVRV